MHVEGPARAPHLTPIPGSGFRGHRFPTLVYAQVKRHGGTRCRFAGECIKGYGVGDFWGMDTEQARGAARTLDELAGRLNTETTLVLEETRSVAWEGADAQEFRAHVTSILSPQVHSTLVHLYGLAHALERNALEQDAASHSGRIFGTGGGGISALSLPNSRSIEALGSIALTGYAALTYDLLGLGPRLVRGVGAANAHTFNHDVGNAADEAMGFLTNVGKGLFLDPRFAVTPTTQPSTIVGITSYRDSHPPQELSDLLAFTEEARHAVGGGEDRENYRVQHFRTAAGEDTYALYMPPTQIEMTKEKAWNGTSGNSRDWASNVGIMTGMEVTTMKNARAALEAANVPKGANVMLIGHSQGGLAAASLASRHDFNGKDGYNVTNVITYGSPVDAFTPAHSNTKVFAIGHKQGLRPYAETVLGGPSRAGVSFTVDPVPLLDLNGLDAPHSPQVTNIDLAPANDHNAGFNTGISFFQPGQAPVDLKFNGYDLEAVHDSMRRLPDGSIDPHYGYYPTLLTQQGINPELLAAKGDIDGLYMGEGLTLVEDTNVQFERTPETSDALAESTSANTGGYPEDSKYPPPWKWEDYR